MASKMVPLLSPELPKRGSDCPIPGVGMNPYVSQLCRINLVGSKTDPL